MKLSGWEFDFASLPHWNNRETDAWCKDYLYESPDATHACLLYCVTEVRMMDYRGFCAILGNKAAPELLLCIQYVNFEPYAHFSRDGKLVFLKAHYRYDKRFILVLNIEKKAYAVVHFCAPVWYELEESESGMFRITFDKERTKDDRRIQRIKNTLIDSENLKWRKWKPLAEGGELHLQWRGGWRDRFKSPDKIWEETIDLAISEQIYVQEFVDLNQNKTLYYFPPFTQLSNGAWRSHALKNERFEGEYQPAFTSLEACRSYLELNGMQHVILKGNLKELMKSMDAQYPTKNWGVVIDPYGDFVIIPPNIRITPKSLRY